MSYTSINDNHTILLQVVCRAFFFHFTSSFPLHFFFISLPNHLYLPSYLICLQPWSKGFRGKNHSMYTFCPSPPLCNIDKTLSSYTSFCILPFSNIEREKGGFWNLFCRSLLWLWFHLFGLLNFLHNLFMRCIYLQPTGLRTFTRIHQHVVTLLPLWPLDNLPL